MIGHMESYWFPMNRCKIEGGWGGPSSELPLVACLRGGSPLSTCTPAIKMLMTNDKLLGNPCQMPAAWLLRHSPASSGILRHSPASSGIPRHPPAFSGILRHPPAFSGISVPCWHSLAFSWISRRSLCDHCFLVAGSIATLDSLPQQPLRLLIPCRSSHCGS